jgi:hypothetical protein
MEQVIQTANYYESKTDTLHIPYQTLTLALISNEIK